jgi:hypothetical protein
MKKILLLTGIVLLAAHTYAGIPDTQAHRAIVGEAAGDGYPVQLGVACAIRNRGHLRGVYGVNAAHNASEPGWVWQAAARAWRESARHDITGGATHFGSISDVRKGTFKGLTLTVVLGTHTHATYFFKR